MSELRIPLALDNMGQLWSPVNANKGINYFCPNCYKPVILKKGDIRVPHFAHKPNNTCNQETVIHKTAKLIIKKIIDEWKSGKKDPPIIKRKCQICGTYINQYIPDKVDKAILEYRLSNGLVVDICLFGEGKPLAAIEIKVTHPVDKQKEKRLAIPFIELDGYKVIENPIIWEPLLDRFKPLICKECKLLYLKFQRKVGQIAKAIKLKLPKSYYRYGICKCWKCKREIIVFAWPGSFQAKSPPKHKPIPRTIKYRFSKTAGTKYWVNTCPYCNAIQGDFFLYIEPDGPFFGVEIIEDSQEAFEKDLMKIALSYFRKH